MSRLQPLLLIAEDIHWSDTETLLLLRRLARSSPEARMLVVATYRDRGEEIGPALSDTLAELSRLDGMTRLSLGKLSEEDVSAFIRASTDAEADGGLASTIGELTGGTPLLVCELWRDLRESGAVEVSGTGVRLSRPVAELRGPERLRDVVRQRLSRLAPQTTATLELASVAGTQFEAASSRSGSGLAAGRSRLPPSRRRFDTAWSKSCRSSSPPGASPTSSCAAPSTTGSPASARAELHLRVGEALESIHAADPARLLPELAHHFTLAAPVAGAERAVDYNLRAADAATAAAAFEEAAARLSTALELGIADPRERARTQVELGYLLNEAGRGSESRLMLAAGLDAATGLEERGIAARALVHEMGHRMGDPELDPDEMRKVTEAAVDTLRQLGDLGGLAVAERYLGLALFRQGRVEKPARYSSAPLSMRTPPATRTRAGS